MRILVKKGYLSHNGIMYKAGDIVDIVDNEIVAELINQDNFEAQEKEVTETLPPISNDGHVDEAEIEEAETTELPEVDASATVKRTTTRKTTTRKTTTRKSTK